MDHRQVFVARRRELKALDAYLQKSIQSQGQVCFITGEAGSGKTALVSEFIERAMKTDSSLVAAVGQSDSQTGMGDPYLPLREILNQLTGDVEVKLAQGAISEENAGRLRKLLGLSGEALTEIGPELIGIFIPAAGLLARAAAFTAQKAGWVDTLRKFIDRDKQPGSLVGSQIEQEHIFEQYTNVIRAVSRKNPLILVLDDLHWADKGSIELLFRICRRISADKILIIGTYRPDELVLDLSGERHPLVKVITELKRYYGDIFVELENISTQEKRTFIDSFLDTEPNRLGNAFRTALFKHTNGHPLFVIELLRNMQERGDLLKDKAGNWVEGPVLNWNRLPTRVEGVIEERLGRLTNELRRTLTIGSVEGENFTAEVIARVQSQDARSLVRHLSEELDRRHRLVSAQGLQRLDSTRLSLYRFNHNLFQRYIYNQLDQIERTYLHEDIGTILEDLYGDQCKKIALQLARHFGIAGIEEKSRHYLRIAGDQAAARYANQEALSCYSRAIELTPSIEKRERFELLMARARVYHLLGDNAEELTDLKSLESLLDDLDDPGSRAQLAFRTAAFKEAKSDYSVAIEMLQNCIHYAELAEDTSIEASANLQWGVILWKQGDYQTALPRLEKALEIARRIGDPQIEAGCLRNIAVVFWRRGDYLQAQIYSQKAIDLFRQLGNRLGEGQVLGILGNIYLRKEDYNNARIMYEKSLRIDRSIGSRNGELYSLGNLGIILCRQDDHIGAKPYFEQVYQISIEIGDRESAGRALGNLATLNTELGSYTIASQQFDEALHIFREIGNRQAECWVLAEIGVLLHSMGQDEASVNFNNKALAIAREIGNKFFENTALNNLGHALIGLRQHDKAVNCFERSLELLQSLDLKTEALYSQAGLAQAVLYQNNLERAHELIQEMLPQLDSIKISGTEGKMHVYLTCYRVLNASNDPRAHQLLEKAHSELQKDVAKIKDEKQQRIFLENLPSYREVLSLIEEGKLNT